MIRFYEVRSERGLTLIETMAALTIFALLLLGVTPIIASSLRGAGLSRTYTFGKNLTQEAMERVRGLPYLVTAPDQDVLDLYFPNMGAGYSAGKFTTTCTRTSSTPTPSAALACPPDNPDGSSQLPDEYTMTFEAEFVQPAASGGEEVYNAVLPSGYDSSTADSTAPSDLLRMTITTTWTHGAKDAEFKLTTLLGERKLSVERFNANATVDFTIQALASYKDSTDRVSNLETVLGRSTSAAELRNFASSNIDVGAARMTLSRREVDGVPGETLVDAAGAQHAMTAPPSNTASATTSGPILVEHPELSGADVAWLVDSSVNESATPAPGATVVNELPRSAANFSVPAGAGELFWLTNQADTSVTNPLQLDSSGSGHMLSVYRTASNRMHGSTSAEATAADPISLREVESSAQTQFAKMVLLPANYIPGDKGVVVIDNFTANVNCKSVGTTSGAVATGAWSATLKFWADSDPSDGVASGAYVEVPLSGSTTATTTDPLAAHGLASNPLVLDSAIPAERVYLFDDPTNDRVGYLESWSSSPLMSATVDDTSSTVNADVALSISTARTDPNNDASKLAIDIGKLSCEAVDARG